MYARQQAPSLYSFLSPFSIRKESVHRDKALIHLTILLELSPILCSELAARFPIAIYAARYRPNHYMGSNQDLEVEDQALRLLQDALQKWVGLWDVEGRDGKLVSRKVPVSLHCNSLLGLHSIVCRLTSDVSSNVNANLIAEGGKYGNTLQAAAQKRNKEVVHVLLEHGADVNAQSGRYGKALQAAAASGNKKVVSFFLNFCRSRNASSPSTSIS